MLTKKTLASGKQYRKVRPQWYIAFLFWWYLSPSWTQPPSHCRSEGPPWTATRPVAPWPSRRSPAVAGCQTWSPGADGWDGWIKVATVCFGKSRGDFAAKKTHRVILHYFTIFYLRTRMFMKLNLWTIWACKGNKCRGKTKRLIIQTKDFV
jgi:hypothetical protein